MPFIDFFGGQGSPTKIDHRKNGTLILTSLLEDLVVNRKFGLVRPTHSGSEGVLGQFGMRTNPFAGRFFARSWKCCEDLFTGSKI